MQYTSRNQQLVSLAIVILLVFLFVMNAIVSADDSSEQPPETTQTENTDTSSEEEPVFMPLGMQTYCQMDINDLQDNNPFTFGFSAVQANNIAAFEWNLGDGTISNAQTVNHTYVTTGTMNISLTCTPNPGYGSPIVLTGSISISSAPAASFSLTPSTSIVGLPPFTISTVNQSTGGALSYHWQITDSSSVLYTSTDKDISYTFNTYGTYWFILTVTDGSGSMASAMQSVVFSAPPPSARFVPNPISGTSPLTVSVNGEDLGTGPITTWSWNFGDGSPIVMGQGPHTHTYTLADPDVYQTFSITLSFSGPGGSGSFTREIGVFPATSPVSADFSWQSMGNTAGGVEICFTNHSSGPVAISMWDFDGDGNFDLTDNSPVVCHTYAVQGTYIVRLRVENSSGTSTSTESKTVSAYLAPVASFVVIPGYSITWGDLITLDGTSSTNADSWEWDFNGDGIIDSTEQIPTNISLTQLGSNPIRLTVRSLGGVSYTEAIVFVALLEITCDFTGNLTVIPTAGPQVYQSVIGSVSGRTVTYNWTITGGDLITPLTYSTQDITVNWAAHGTGAFVVTLEASTPDGANCSKTKTVTRAYSALECLMTDNLPSPLYANGNLYTFTAQVNNLEGRSITGYRWFVDGVEQIGQTGANFTRAWSTPPASAFDEVISYEVTVDNGDGQSSDCLETKTVTLNPWPTPVCQISTNIPGTVYADGNTYTFSANISGLFGRPVTNYRWFFGGVEQTGLTGSSVSWQNITDSALTEYSTSVSYIATVDNGNGTSTDCAGTYDITVREWPALTCGSISGSTTPIPATPDNPARFSQYNLALSGVAGRSVEYTWSVDTGTVTTTNPRIDNDQARITWPSSAALAAPGAPSVISVTAVVTNPDGTTQNTNCTQSLNVMVQVPHLICNLPSGDNTPVMGETVTYTRSLTNQYGRAISAMLWELERNDSGVWVPVTTGTSANFNYTFNLADTEYRLRYATIVSDPDDNCDGSPWYSINTYDDGVDFFCDAFPNGYGNNFSPSSASGSYAYTIDMDNGNNIPLRYTWVLVGPNTTERVLASVISSQDGFITFPAFSGVSLGPVANYTLRVDVEAVNSTDPLAPDYSQNTCSMSRALVVGTLSVAYSYIGGDGGAVNNSAVAVGQAICFTNNSSTSHGGVGELDYDWNISGSASANSLGATHFTSEQLPGCISFSEPGQYTITLDGRNRAQGDASYERSASYSVTFAVYGLQNIAITRSAQAFAPASVNFQATGTNITSGYTWHFYNSGGGLVATRTGANVNQLFNTPDTYRAVVSGSGPLGITTSEIVFTLMETNQLRAAFTPSVYGGVAPMTVCFTDRSLGNNILTWAWDFGNGDTLNYTAGNIPSSICATYNTPSTTYTVRLVITNSALTETATNTVRTYSLLESSASFSISPAGSAQYCFQANLVGNVVVTGWEFGDTQTGPGQPFVCHAYNASGTYLVQMNIRDQGTNETGTVLRTVVVDLSGGTPPALSITGNCSPNRVATFRITNSGGSMTTPEQIVIRDNNGAVIFIDNVLLAGGAHQDFSVSDQSGNVSIQAVDAGLSASTFCNYTPDIQVAASCSSGTPVFTVINNRYTNGPMIAPQTFEIRDSAGNVVVSGSFELTVGVPSVDVSVPQGSNPFDTYSFVSSGAVGTFNVDHTCGTGAALEINRTCGETTAFTLTNISPYNMVWPQSFTITDSKGHDVTPVVDTFRLDSGASYIAPLTGADPYGVYTLRTNGFVGDYTVTRGCDKPQLGISGLCVFPQAVTVTNLGADMLTDQTYRLTNAHGQDITPAGNVFRLARGQQLTISVSGADMSAGVSFVTNGLGASANAIMQCDDTNSLSVVSNTLSAATTASSLPGALSLASFTSQKGVFNGLSADVLNLPSWDSVPVCGHNCPPFRLYHTDETGDWEIFRLDGANAAARTSDRKNLTFGENTEDMSPSLSPNSKWIVFSSNRDGNWEIYVASTSGDPSSVQRVTYNTIAIDTDPVWGPNNYVVFETTRHGNWDLYMVDMSTGVEYRLTDNGANDINPYWSPDGSKLIFQSDRDGKGLWQIYELNLTTMSLRKLSDGTRNDVDPQYADDGQRIVFRTYPNEGDNSVIAIMDVNGKNRAFVTQTSENATNPVWSPGSRFIAYQSDLDGDLDVYVYDTATRVTRQLTDNDIDDYAPAWLCGEDRLMFTSNINGDPDIYEADVLPLTAPPIRVEDAADQLTFEPSQDIYPQNTPSEENASREGQTVNGEFGQQTSFLNPEANLTPPDLGMDGLIREDWAEIESCPVAHLEIEAKGDKPDNL